ncbi:MAG: hypothetical protein CMJ43_18540 [Phyllobacteriaceae bacterium]|nr:hypothetical protein [Phyllobacteriaceae bacterium]
MIRIESIALNHIALILSDLTKGNLIGWASIASAAVSTATPATARAAISIIIFLIWIQRGKMRPQSGLATH